MSARERWLELFVGEYHGPLHPSVIKWCATGQASTGGGYGEDKFTQALRDNIKRRFNMESALASTGTAANLLMAENLDPGRRGIVCTTMAHIKTFEEGGLAKLFGARLIVPKNSLVKLDLGETQEVLRKGKSSIVSITVADERGGIVELGYLSELRRLCDKYGALLHVDGARVYYAAAAMNIKVEEIMGYADTASFGHMKVAGPSEIFLWRDSLNPPLVLRRMLGHDKNNTRGDAYALLKMMKTQLPEKLAKNANRLARMLALGILGMGAAMAHKQETNQVFIEMSKEWSTELVRRVGHYNDYGDPGSSMVVSRFNVGAMATQADIVKVLEVMDRTRNES